MGYEVITKKRMRRFGWINTLVVGMLLLSWTPLYALPLHNPGPDLFTMEYTGNYICSLDMTQRYPERCPSFSRGAQQVRIAYLRSRLPNPLPELPVEELEASDEAVTSYTFAIVRPLPVATYKHPEEAAAGLPPVREFIEGDNWVSVMGSVEYNGETWYEINSGEFIRAEHLALTRPSHFQGVRLAEQPQYPFGWINRDINPSPTPGGEPRADVLLRRYEMINIFGQEQIGEKLWYMIGPDLWVEQSYTSRVDVDPMPDGVQAGEKWIEVNTFEQTLAAYEGERMVFATLVSTGRSHTWTPDGLTRIWSKFTATPMANRETTPDDPAWYYLEDVEWTQYFNGAYALHTAYWHNAFGFTRSHGCVNMAPLDAKWLFGWTTPYVPENASVVKSNETQVGTWVWVHRTPPIPGM